MSKNFWTETEDKILKENWGETERGVLLSLLPGRDYQAIKGRALNRKWNNY